MAIRLPAARRRRQLLEVATRVFAERGFHDTSMDDVAEAAGVTKPVLYQHFASKRELYVELLGDISRQLAGAIADATAEAGGPRLQVELGFTAYFRFVASHAAGFRLLFGGGSRQDPELADFAERVEDSMADLVAGLIDADLDHDHRRLLAYGIVGLAEATSRHLMSGSGDIDPERAARRLADLAWAGLRGIKRD
jgi:AcrR family transcriptional regulator